MTSAVHAEFDRAVVRALGVMWTQHNADDFGGGLRPPALALHDGGPLGQWEPRDRRISLQRAFVRAATWGQVVEVLRHEMAHQYVSEVLKAEEPAHGPRFQGVCARRGIDRKAAGLPTDTDVAGERLLRKVRGLLALANSPNAHEAEAAARTARRLLAEHDLTLDPSGTSYTFVQVGPAKMRFDAWEKALASVLSRHFGVQALYATAFLPDRAAWGRILELVGSTDHVAVAAYVHDALRTLAEGQWRAYKKARGLRSDGARRTFLYGLMRGFDESLTREAVESPGTALVRRDDPELRTYFRKRHPRLSTGSGYTVYVTEELEAGRDAGRSLQIRPGVGGADGPRQIVDKRAT